jgi:hypothetical protein
MGELVDEAKYREYQKRIATVEASAGEVSQGNASYWWNLYLIYRDKSWEVMFPKFTDWLGDFCSSSYGCSRQSFYTRIKNIKRWQSLGLEDEKIIVLLGSRSETAIQSDIDEWFDEKGELKESVALRIEEGHESPGEYLERASQLSPGEARQEVQRVTTLDKIYPIPDSCVYDEMSGTLLFNVRWDTEEDGCVWMGSCRITGVQLAPEQSGNIYLPEKIARFIVKKLSLRL